MMRFFSAIKIIIFLMVVGLLGCQQSSTGMSARSFTLQYEDIASPVFQISDDAVSVVLPGSVLAAMQEYYPDYQFPKISAPAGGLVSYSEEAPVPFLIEGDFNSDGQMDLAGLLVQKNNARDWKMVVFHRQAMQYRPQVLISSDSFDQYGLVDTHGLHAGPYLTLLKYAAVQYEFVWDGRQYIERSISG